MNSEDIARAFEEISDDALLFHSFTDYIRDYQVLAGHYQGPTVRFVFKYCVKATVTTTLTPAGWIDSWDERLIDHEKARELEGYVWGAKWQTLNVIELLPSSEEATEWSSKTGRAFHEAVVDANGHRISLIFSDLEVSTAEPGLAPFVLRA